MSSMRKTVVAFAALACVFAARPSWGKAIGIWKDERSAIAEGMLKTLQDDGWQTVILAGKDLSDEAKLAGLDVVFLPGGWNAYWFADFNARRAVVKFVASGKGVLAGAFRGGYTRTCNRPFFPEVGETFNRVNGPYIAGSGDSELARAIDKPFCPGGWDHLVIKPGPAGKVFAASGGDPVGVYGEIHGGRYLLLGAFIGSDAKSNGMEGTSRQVMLKTAGWLAGAPKLSDAGKARQQARADLDFLRRERAWDWTLNERGPDRGSGVIPTLRNQLAVPLESRLYTLQYMSRHLSGDQLAACQAAEGELKKAVAELDGRFQKIMAETRAGIDKMTAEELAAENPFLSRSNVLRRIESAPGKTDEAKAKMKAGLGDTFAPRTVAMFLHGEEISGKLMPDARKKELVSRADKAISDLRPSVKAAKAAKLAAERRSDQAAVPGLIVKCSSSAAAARLEAVIELGRIGDARCVQTLIKMLKDSDGKVRVNAIIGLGWMQSREAVPELLTLAGGKDAALRRRAVQALGQIGDDRAVKTLAGLIGDQDYDTAENAIFALGWLKAGAAAGPLLKLVSGADKADARQRGLALAAIRALGHIGDASALPVLEELAAKAGDFPAGRRGGKRITNIYSTADSLGFQGLAELAAAEIKAGGRKEKGIRQADALAASDKFYGLSKRFNALAGRSSILRDSNFADDHAALFPCLWEAGFTGVHQAWGEENYPDPEKYAELVRAAGDFDLLWIDVMPTGGNNFGSRDVSGKYGTHGLEKPGAEVVLLKYGDAPAFGGFWCEETYPDMSIPSAE
ncbi:MAG: HEAT repeat domain-containing protein, partial [Lentisphaerae bacterium]|nr:HEAT repeat domain-containing protein [Lentisphaerota bacterium]